MEIINEPQIDPDLDGIGDAIKKVETLLVMLENGGVKDARATAYNLKGYLQALEKYFDLVMKKCYNLDN